jgi:hypothetical protein
MKNQIIIMSVLVVSSVTTFSQGYFRLSAGKNTVWDDFTTPGVSEPSAGTVNVAWLIGPASSTIPSLGSTGSPTNTPPAFGGSGTSLMNLPGGWSYAATGGTTWVATTGTGAWAGSFAANGGTGAALDGTSVGTTYTMYVVGWNASAGTAAILNGSWSILGWSNPMQVTAAAVTGPFQDFSANGGSPFGLAVPEPCTFALSGLGAAALLIFRRRKQDSV